MILTYLFPLPFNSEENLFVGVIEGCVGQADVAAGDVGGIRRLEIKFILF